MLDFPSIPLSERRMAPMSRDARRTVRADTLISIGRHPVNGLPTDRATTCGNCAHLSRHHCTKCASTIDVRSSWPGCPFWDQK